MQAEVSGTYMMQLSTVDSNSLHNLPSKLFREATAPTLKISRILKVLNYDVRGCYMAFLDTLTSIFKKSPEKHKFSFLKNSLQLCRKTHYAVKNN